MGPGSDNKRNKVPVFDGEATSFLIWKQRFLSYLRTLSDDERYHKLLTNENDSSVSDKDKRRVFDLLLEGLRDEEATLILPVADCDGITAWKIVVDRFQSKVTARASILYAQLTTMKMEPAESGQDFLTRVQNMEAALKAIGSKVEEALVVSTALRGMSERESHKLFVASYSMKADSEQTTLLA